MNTNSQELYKEAYNFHYSFHDFSKAIELYKRVIEQFPESAEARYSRTQIENIENMSEIEKANYIKKQQEIQNSNSEEKKGKLKYYSTYGTTKTISEFISFIGWGIVIISIIAAIIVIVKSSESRYGGVSLIDLLPLLGGAISGLIIVVLGQLTRATVDTADYCGEMLSIMKSKKE